MRKGVVRAGGVVAVLGGIIGIVSVFLWASDLAARVPGGFSLGLIWQFTSFGGLAVGLIGIGVALFGLPDG